ncbi:putative transmembrane protein [Stenotrophomonas maltophilia K279a]|uniref:Transmembrane protein n=3 Tax=Stenotrophomonas maltophilia TaxID=40324 RepID=B2FJI7_STRMK|nr:putative transmembrane protein [Stenotrophomonas maltophilia K279a]
MFGHSTRAAHACNHPATMLHAPAPAHHDAIALQAGVLGSVLGVALYKAIALSALATGSLIVIGLWLLACALLAAWALAACLACLALSRRVFVLMLALSMILMICVA